MCTKVPGEGDSPLAGTSCHLQCQGSPGAQIVGHLFSTNWAEVTVPMGLVCGVSLQQSNGN